MPTQRPLHRLAVCLSAAFAMWLLIGGVNAALAAGHGEAPPPTYRWRQVNVGLEDPFAMQFSSNFGANGQVYAFSDHNTLWLGYGQGTLFRSGTRGRAWEVYDGPSPQYGFKLVAVSPETPTGPVFLAVEAYYDQTDFNQYYRLVRSTAPPLGWTTVWDKSPLFNQIVFSPAFATDQTVFVVWADSPNGGIWRSTDGGATWQPTQKIAVHPNNGRVVSSLGNGVFRSTDRGDAWQAPTTVLASCSAVAPGNATATDRLLWAACGGALYRSADEGATWISDSPSGASVTHVVASPDGAGVFVGTSNRGIYRRERVYTVALPLVIK